MLLTTTLQSYLAIGHITDNSITRRSRWHSVIGRRQLNLPVSVFGRVIHMCVRVGSTREGVLAVVVVSMVMMVGFSSAMTGLSKQVIIRRFLVTMRIRVMLMVFMSALFTRNVMVIHLSFVVIAAMPVHAIVMFLSLQSSSIIAVFESFAFMMTTLSVLVTDNLMAGIFMDLFLLVALLVIMTSVTAMVISVAVVVVIAILRTVCSLTNRLSRNLSDVHGFNFATALLIAPLVTVNHPIGCVMILVASVFALLVMLMSSMMLSSVLVGAVGLYRALVGVGGLLHSTCQVLLHGLGVVVVRVMTWVMPTVRVV